MYTTPSIATPATPAISKQTSNLPTTSFSTTELETFRTTTQLVASFLTSAHTIGTADTTYIEGIVQEAYAAASKIYGIRDAQTWAEGFSFPLHAPEVYERDANLFTQFHGSIEKLCDHHHKAMADNRLSDQRVQHLLGMKGEKCTGVSQADFW
jgi:hypothetical protein